MTRRNLGIAAAVCLLPLLAWAIANQQDRDAQWQKYQEAMKKGLPRTAISELEPIIASAMKDKKYPEAIKAIAKKIALEGNIQGNKPEEKILLMRAAIAKVPAEMVPVMDTILANWYWHYFQQNRWRFLQRTMTNEQPSEDFKTWDLARLFTEVDKQFTKSLSAEKMLKQIPIGEYEMLLEKATVPDSYRPTLYDFLAHNALAFYSTGEQAAAKAQDEFEVQVTSPMFAPVEEFMSWKVQATQEDSRTVKAIKIYQDLLKFHKDDKDRAAFLDADLFRLNYGYNKANGEGKQARYKDALKHFVAKNGDHEVAARALHDWAQVLFQEENFVEARAIAQRAVDALPNSVGGKLSFNLIQTIEAKQSHFTVERVWNNPLPTVEVRYKNLTKLYLRAVSYDYSERLKIANYRPEYLNEGERKALLAKQPAAEWSVELPATQDYHERVEKVSVPKDLKAGFYFLIGSHNKEFGADSNTVHFTDFWVSNLAIVTHNHHGWGVLDGFILDAITGSPLAGAEVQGWQRTQQGARIAMNPVKTDENGKFTLPGNNQWGYLLLAKHKDQQLASAHEFHTWGNRGQNIPHSSTVFFTDRSLYRPGQTVQYKGLTIFVDQEHNDYKVLKNTAVTVVLRDINGKEVARQAHKSNDYGSFNGSFTTPTDRGTGQMSIAVIDSGHFGQTTFNVEEYKRPKFLVEVEKPKVASKLNDLVIVSGKANAYTGAPIDGAKVRYRVSRQVRYPDWWGWRYWWMPPRPTTSQEIANGFALTEKDGSFKIEFIARPDEKVPAKEEPIFRYAISADVTDSSGETRTGQTTINVAYTALRATITAEDWLTTEKEVKLTVGTMTLDGEPQAAEGVLKVYRLKQPEKVVRKGLQQYYWFPRAWILQGKEPPPDASNSNSWELAEVAFERNVKTDEKGKAEVSVPLPAGPFRVILETKDRYGKAVSARLPIQVLDPGANQLTTKVPHLLNAPRWKVEPGKEFTALWGTGYDSGRAYIEIEHRQKILKSYWTDAQTTQSLIKQAVTEDMRGGFTVRVTMVRENRAYLETKRVDVPWTNKDLSIRWERFVSKLEPGQKVTWTAVVTGPEAKKAVAEMVACLYDESLDAYRNHDWMHKFSVFRQDYSHVSMMFENQLNNLQYLHGRWPSTHKSTDWRYRTFPHEIAGNFWGYQYFDGGFGGGGRHMLREAAMAPGAPMPGMANSARGNADGMMQQDRQAAEGQMAKADAKGGGRRDGGDPNNAPGGGPDVDLSKVSARKNLNETAFFFPHLVSDKDGEVRIEFTMPEALTKWKFLGFVHDAELRSGYLQDHAVTAKDLMVQPHPPRFLREGDLLAFTVKVTNQSHEKQSGKVSLTFSKATNSKSIDAILGNASPEQTFEIPAKESRSYAWKIKVPDDAPFMIYKAVASTGKIADGEEGYLPVLAKRVLVTESLPLPLRNKGEKHFEFTRLLKSKDSDTIKHQQVTVQMVSNPNWYGVMALPYLMEYPHLHSEAIFNRLYANGVARHIANSSPNIKNVFEQWKGTPALDSPLLKNKDLLAVMIEETPWLRDAENESQARRNVGILFDDNRMNAELARAHNQLVNMQLGDGAFPWFPGGLPNEYITLYITTGYGRMRHLNVNVDAAPAVRAVSYLDGRIEHRYREILRLGLKDKVNIDPHVAMYLYGRSFFLKDQKIAPNHQEAVDYFLGQAKAHWLKVANRQSQAHMALGLWRFGDKETPKGIMASIKERSVSHEEMGMFWRDLELSWWWFRAPIETQAMMIEAFDEVMNDKKSVEDCKVWLLRQKHTQNWRTTKATADAVYAMLLRGSNPLASDALVEIYLAGQLVRPEKVEAGTGFYEKRYHGGDIKPELGTIVTKKTDEGVSWGNVTWSYLEDVAKLTPYEGTPLTLKKKLFTRIYTKKGPQLVPVVDGAVKVGDELIVRMELRVDRDMEYVHLKDARGSGTEPVNVLSHYKYQDGLRYYESTRDTASHFFIDYLPKGTYVFEYATRVVHRGEYQTGMAQIQCMYAPEYNSHSESYLLRVE